MTNCDCNCETTGQFGTDFCEQGECWLCDFCDCKCSNYEEDQNICPNCGIHWLKEGMCQCLIGGYHDD